MDRESRVTRLIIVVVGSLIIISVWSIYQAYQTTGYSPTFASTLATFTLVVITAWYAWSTRKLLGATQAQIKATRASYAPQLDAHVATRGEDFFSVDIVNRGQGVARDIEVEVRIYTTRLGVHSAGERYRFIAHIKPSLPPNSALGERPGKPVRITPHFYTKVSEESFSDVESRGQPEDSIPGVPEDVIRYLSEYMSKADSGSGYPTETGDIVDLLNLFADRDNRPRLPIFEVLIRYNDTLTDSESYEDVIFRSRLDVAEERFNQAIETMPTVFTSRGLRRRFGEFVLDRARAVTPKPARYWDLTPPYETDISAPVVNAERAVEDREDVSTNQ